MAKKIIATFMCLLMMATLLPLGGMASTETANDNLVVNGGFETALEADTLQPEDWTVTIKVNKDATSTAVKGTNCMIETNSQNVFSGSNAYKIVGTGNETISLGQKLNLTEGKRYRVEAYLHMTEGTGASIYIGRNGVGGSRTGTLMAGSETLTQATNGYTKVSGYFSCSANTTYYVVAEMTGAGTAYFDDIAIYETDSLLQYSGGFDDNKKDIWSKSSSVSIVEITENGYKNRCLKVEKADSASEAVTMNLEKAVLSSAIGKMLHVSMRVKIEGADTLEGKNFRVRVYESFAADGVDGKNSIGFSLSSAEQDEWLQLEMILPFYSENATTVNGIRFWQETGYTYYLDDVECEVLTKPFIYTGNQLSNARESYWYQETEDGPRIEYYWTRGWLFKPVTSFSATDIVKPFICHITESTVADTALAITAVYKQTGTTKQLIDVMAEDLTAIAKEPAYSEKSIDLSTLNLEAGTDVTYSVETYLWNGTGLSPAVEKDVKPITVTSIVE